MDSTWQSLPVLNTFNMAGFVVGVLFGAALFLGGLADPDKIVGTLRLKDLHALRTIVVFVLVGMLGTWILQLTGYAHGTPKPATLVTVVLGGALLGVGFGMTGYCPGTGLACAVAGRFDALVTVLGMFAGAALFIWAYPEIIRPVEKLEAYDFGKVTILEYFGVQDDSRFRYGLVPAIFVIGAVLLYLTRPRKQRPAAAYAPAREQIGRMRTPPRHIEIEPRPTAVTSTAVEPEAVEPERTAYAEPSGAAESGKETIPTPEAPSPSESPRSEPPSESESEFPSAESTDQASPEATAEADDEDPLGLDLKLLDDEDRPDSNTGSDSA